MNLTERRRAIRHLLSDYDPADAQAVYYAIYHPDRKTQLITFPEFAEKAEGYICLSKTGIDLFRPLVTMRFPLDADKHNLNLKSANELLRKAIPEGMGVIINTKITYRPLLNALLDVQNEQVLKLMVLDKDRFEPIINLFVTEADSPNDLARFVIRQNADGLAYQQGDPVAVAGVNWQTSQFAEIYAHTKINHRREGLGRSVVAALVQHLLEIGRTPLYVVNAENEPSIQLAKSLGFYDSGETKILIEGQLRLT